MVIRFCLKRKLAVLPCQLANFGESIKGRLPGTGEIDIVRQFTGCQRASIKDRANQVDVVVFLSFGQVRFSMFKHPLVADLDVGDRNRLKCPVKTFSVHWDRSVVRWQRHAVRIVDSQSWNKSTARDRRLGRLTISKRRTRLCYGIECDWVERQAVVQTRFAQAAGRAC